MLTKRIIPCLDVDRGRVVKGTNFVGLRDAGDPVEVARRYETQGADELVFLDISASHGGRVPTGLEAVAWARKVEELGAGEIVLTSMDADGTKNGYDLPMLEAVGRAVNIPVVASGGAGSPEHLLAAFAAGADAALAASIFHYNEYSIPDTKAYLAARGVPVRVVPVTSVNG